MTSFDLDVLVNGRPIRRYFDSQGNTFVEGRKGSEYTLQIRSRSVYKAKAVISVDGLNILTGDSTWERGYVVEGYGQVIIPGWRINQDSVARFVFSDLKDGYNQSSQANSGVIGLRVHLEQPATFVPVNNRHMVQTTVTAPVWGTAAPLIGSGQISAGGYVTNTTAPVNAVNDVATGWGNQTEFVTKKDTTTQFYSTPTQTTVIYYDSARGLEKRGIYVGRPQTPNPFPQAVISDGCPPPKR